MPRPSIFDNLGKLLMCKRFLVNEAPMKKWYVEFCVDDEERFVRLKNIYDALRVAKDAGQFEYSEDWLKFLAPDDISRLWWPTEDELEERRRIWYSTPVALRNQIPRSGWTFESLIGAFNNGDYAIENCERLSPRAGRLVFDPWGHPYGGTEPFQGLIEAFGFAVTEVSD
jgi:hypothetical protein